MTVLAVDYQKGVSDAFAKVATFVPKLVLFLVILVVGIIIAKIVRKILVKVLQKAGFDGLVERGGIKKALAKSEYDAAGILGKVVYYFIFLGVLSLAFSAFGANNPVSMFIDKIVSFLPNVFVAVVVVVLAAAIATAVKELLTNTLGGLSYGAAVANAASIFIIGLGVFFALDQLKIAPHIVTGLFYAVLVLTIAPLVIAFGVGGIEPARQAITDAQAKGKVKAQEIKNEASSSTPEVAPTATRTPRAVKATSARRRTL